MQTPSRAMPWEDTASLVCLHLLHLQHDVNMTKLKLCSVKVSVPDCTCVLQAPGKMYTRICVISDILPSEWPPVQVRKGVPHPPPTHREYRVALANGLIPLKQDFRDMVTTAVASDSRMFRAALVRLVARASGLQAPTCNCMCHLMLPIPSTNRLFNQTAMQLINQFCCHLKCHMLQARKGTGRVVAVMTQCAWSPLPSCTIVYAMTESATVVFSPGIWGLYRPGRGHGGFLG